LSSGQVVWRWVNYQHIRQVLLQADSAVLGSRLHRQRCLGGDPLPRVKIG